MKKILLALSSLLLIALLALGLTLSASAEEDVIHSGTWGDLTWTLNEATGKLTISGTGEMNSFSLTSSEAWNAHTNTIESIVIEEGVTSIGASAFQSCQNLVSITIPNGVTRIEDLAFRYCKSLASITLPDGVTSIGNWAFADCTSLANIRIPNSVTSIGNNTFYYCSSLASMTIPDGVTSIGNNTFYSCSSLTSIALPNSVTSIGNNAFYYCSSLTGVAIPNSVTSIGDFAFSHCSRIASITLPKGVTRIGNDTFSNCISLKSISIPDSVTSFGAYAFSGCSNLATITIPNGVTTVGEYCFKGCSQFTDITLPNSVTSIGEGAFSGCTSLKSMTLPFVGGSVKTENDPYQYPFGYIFGTASYSGGTATTQHYYGSDINTSYPPYTTYYIPQKLKSVTVTGGNILYGAFQNCINLETIVLPNEITTIHDCAFESCRTLSQITIPDSVTSIGNKAFYSSGITRIKFSEKSQLASIGSQTFYSTGIDVIVIPDSVTSIGDQAFYKCIVLERITFGENSQLTSIGMQTFYACETLTSIVIPNAVKSIGNSAFSGCTNLANITISASVESIGLSAFYECRNLSTLTILENSNLKTIGKRAFDYCENLTSISLPDSVTSIGDSAFNYCTKLKTVIFTENSQLASIGNTAFYCCRALESISIGECKQLASIGESAFFGCSSLKSIAIPGSVTSLGAYAFRDCSSLASVVFDENIQLAILKLQLFYRCTALTNLIVPSSVTHIDSSAFSNCTGLISIIIPNSVIVINPKAFKNCTSLTSITYCGSPSEWAAIAKGNEWNLNTGAYTLSYHSYPDGKDKCMVCGHFRDGIASLYGYSISLNGDISINFYFDVTEETRNDKDAYILITYPNGTTETILLSEARTKTAGGITYYLVNPALPAKEINSIISARIVLGDGTEGILYEKSIRGYAEALIANADSYSAEQVTLMEKLIAYGEAASAHFGGESVEHQMTEITAETLKAYEIQKSGSPDAGLSYFGSSVLLESETTIRHYFRLTSGEISDHSFLVDGKAVTPMNETGTTYWYIDVPNIVSKDLDRVYTVEADGMTIEYSVLSYAYTALLKYSDDPFSVPVCNTVKALYEYNLAANAYFEN